MRLFITLILSNVWFLTFSQTDSSSIKSQNIDAVHIDRNFDLKYQQKLWLVRRAYPLALEAKKIIDDYEAEISAIEKKRKQKKHGKTLHKELKADFSYILKDLYVDEGKMLMKLIHRETGMSVNEIIYKYRGKQQAALTRTTFKLFGHNTQAQFDSEGDDWITEIVLQDIENGRIEFDTQVKDVSKSEYKKGMKDYRNRSKASRKRKRKSKKKPSKRRA